MSAIPVLIEEIRKSRGALARIEEFFDRVVAGLGRAGRSEEKALVIGELLSKYYTCVETIFLRISQFFENRLSRYRWHGDLLEKMTLTIEGVRQAAISDGTRDALAELLKFRHFTRYYYQVSYDWDRLDLLMKKFAQVRPMLSCDLDRFLAFLHDLEAAAPEED